MASPSGQDAACPYPGGSLRMQMPLFAALGLDLSGSFAGTINVDVGPRTFRVIGGDHVFRAVRWTERIPPEDFTFSRAELEVAGHRHPAWIYWPHPETKVEHVQGRSLAEIIAPRIDGLVYGARCRLHVRTAHVESSLPSREQAPLPAAAPFTLRLRLRRRSAPRSRILFRQASNTPGRPGFLLEEMPDGGLRASFVFDRPGRWPEGQIALCHAHQTFMARLPYWRHPGDIDQGLLRLCVPGAMVETDRWLDLVFTHDGHRLAVWLDGVLLDEDWPYGAPALAAAPAEQIAAEWELAANGWIVESRAWTDELALASAPATPRRADELLGPEEPFGAYWRPRGINTSAGDVMVGFDGRRFHLLVLTDRRNHGSRWVCGAYEFEHWSTEDLRTWSRHPPALTLEKPEECALGTGGLLFHEGKAHVWGLVYSNRLGAPATELAPPGVVRATSEDGVNFRRVPGRWLDACEPGIWHEPARGVFHLVRTARRMESRDLLTWAEADANFLPPPGPINGPDDKPTEECYTVFSWNGWFYILGGRTGFWMARDIRGPFWAGPDGDRPAVRPRWDIYDGAMVPQGVVIHDNRCLLVGWVVDQWWGGRLVFRELRQCDDGTLALGWVPELIPPCAAPEPLAPEAAAESAIRDGADFVLRSPDDGFSAQAFELPPGDAHLEFRLRPEGKPAAFGLCLRASADYRGGRELRLDPRACEARWGSPDGGPAPRIDRPKYYAEDFAINEVDGLDGEVLVRVILRNWVVDAWINGERTILTRQHAPAGDRLFVFVQGGALRFAAPRRSPLGF